jgi:hypothetical protein
MFDDGSIDGLIFADDSFVTVHPGAVKVDAAIGSDDFAVFTKKADLSVRGWDSLRNLTIGYRTRASLYLPDRQARRHSAQAGGRPRYAMNKRVALRPSPTRSWPTS